ncbi:hypothetical protein JDS87_30015 [Bacillus cereus]|uniref:hypothetical protein n=1 Tax=Bacillus cereus TaxID=1396 RepID=UPI0018F6A132|nr:hypothetical protein [Bacillus cereus]MBJ8055991.1 hypothetical protein [Bacillus cereus]
MKNNINVYVGLISSVSIFILSLFYIYFNPYSGQISNKEVFIIVLFLLLLPSFWAIISIIKKEYIFILICSIWLLPGGVYLGISTIPSVWNLYILFLFVYFLSIFRMKAT